MLMGEEMSRPCLLLSSSNLVRHQQYFSTLLEGDHVFSDSNRQDGGNGWWLGGLPSVPTTGVQILSPRITRIKRRFRSFILKYFDKRNLKLFLFLFLRNLARIFFFKSKVMVCLIVLFFIFFFFFLPSKGSMENIVGSGI